MADDSRLVKKKIRDWWDDSDPHEYEELDAHALTRSEARRWVEVLNHELSVSDSPKSVLDVGTGTGFLAFALAKFGYNVYGVDYAESRIERAREKSSEKDTEGNTKFAVDDAENLSLSDGRVDGVVGRHLLWTLVKPVAAFREWRRVTKPGGKIIVDVPKKSSRHGDHHFNRPDGDCVPFYSGAEPDEIIDTFEKAGIEEVSVQMKGGADEKKYFIIAQA